MQCLNSSVVCVQCQDLLLLFGLWAQFLLVRKELCQANLLPQDVKR